MKKAHHSADSTQPSQKVNLRWMQMLVFAGLLLFALLLTGTGCDGLCSEYLGSSSLSNVNHRAVVNDANPEILQVWVDIEAGGVYSPSLTPAEGNDEVQGLPSYLDELAGKGYLAIRVPHAPPTYTASSLIPGIPPWSPNAIEFRYYSPPDSPTVTTVPITVARAPTYETMVNALYPIKDGHSHWEVWWIEGDSFPIPTDTFRLADVWPQAIEVAFRIDFGSGANATDCQGCPLEVLLYNGYSFIGPFDAPLVIKTAPASPNIPLAVFDQGCTSLTATYLQYIKPTAPFSQTHWLGNYDAITRTFTITTASSQNWDYAYYYGLNDQPLQVVAGLPFTVSVGPGQPGSWPPPPCLNITAVYTPTIAMTDTIRETLWITATSVISPEVWTDMLSVALAPGYQLDEGEPGGMLYLPLAMKQRP